MHLLNFLDLLCCCSISHNSLVFGWGWLSLNSFPWKWKHAFLWCLWWLWETYRCLQHLTSCLSYALQIDVLILMKLLNFYDIRNRKYRFALCIDLKLFRLPCFLISFLYTWYLLGLETNTLNFRLFVVLLIFPLIILRFLGFLLSLW